MPAHVTLFEGAAGSACSQPRTSAPRRGRENLAAWPADAQIAQELFISVSTVRTHLDRIRDKSGFRRRADLTRLALREGLI
jgi:hypothetical protein